MCALDPRLRYTTESSECASKTTSHNGLDSLEWNTCRVQGDSINIKVPKSEADGLINNQQENFSFKMDGVLENASQDAVYSTTTHEVVDSLLAGINGTVFCYGQTAAGKTYTMSGERTSFQQRGLIPHALHTIFREIDARVDKMYKVHVSYLEIYCEQLYDLLSDSPGSGDSLSILDDPQQGTYVRGLGKIAVSSEEEALMQYFAGEQGRSTASHVLNASSSRSHCIFTIHVETRNSDAASERALVSKLHLVDLAGSERTKKTGATGQTLVEAQFINRSLSFLEQTVNALSRKDSHVPYRQSKLTSVLKDALGGNCKTVMIANIHLEPKHVEETLSTLRFASRVRTLVTEVGVNESSDPSLLLHRYERQIKELKAELAMRDALNSRGRVAYEDPTDAEVMELNALARRFLSGSADLEELPCDTLKRIKETYRQMRAVFQSYSADVEAKLKQGGGTSGGEQGQAASSIQPIRYEETAGDGVGEAERGVGKGGFAIGIAPGSSKPPIDSTLGSGSPKGLMGRAGQSDSRPGEAEHQLDSTSPLGNKTGALYGSTLGQGGSFDRNEAFARFKRDTEEGKAIQGLITFKTQQLVELKVTTRSISLLTRCHASSFFEVTINFFLFFQQRQVKESSESVNAAKQEIDKISYDLQGKKLSATASEASSDPPLDSEHYQLLQQLKSAKQKYRTDFDRLKEQRSALDEASYEVGEAKKSLFEEFEKWMSAPYGASFALAQNADDEDLDAGEAFERMQIGRVVASNPDGAAFHAALRKAQAISPVKGFQGVKAAAEATRKREHEKAIAAGLVKG